MQRVFSFEIRLEAVRLHEEEDLSPGAIAKKIGTVHSVVERWLKLYKYNGIEGLKIKDYNQQYDDDLKSKVIEQVTVQNLEIVQIDLENNVILVKGNVPGPKKSLVLIKASVKHEGTVNEKQDLITYVIEEPEEVVEVVEANEEETPVSE